MGKELRIYHVQSKLPRSGADVETVDHLVEASGKAAAYQHVCKTYVGEATLAGQREIADLVGRGVKVETAKEGG